MRQTKQWFSADEGMVNKTVLDYVNEVERRQSAMYDRFVKLEALYDPESGLVDSGGQSAAAAKGILTENVIATNVDTVTACIAASDVQVKVQTDDGDWSTQRTARHLEWYAEGMQALLEIPQKTRNGFKAAAKKGTAWLKVYADDFDQPRVDEVLVDDIVVDDMETRNGAKPKQMHQWHRNADRDELKARFPEHEAEIDRAHQTRRSSPRSYGRAGYGDSNEIEVLESWRLPLGTQGHDRYRPGRHTITIDGCDLLDEEYHKPFFPFARMAWVEREGSWFGISLAERLAGHQRSLNRMNMQVDRQRELGAFPITYVTQQDAKLAVTSMNRAGSIVVYRGEKPITVTPAAVHPELPQSIDRTKMSAQFEAGVSAAMASGTISPGLESGVAVREERHSRTQRFALQEKAYEQFVLDTVWLVLDVCKDLGAAAPVIMRKTRFGAKKVPWSKVDMGDVRIQLAAASTLPRTPAGRMQTVMEWAQAGVISMDEARRLIEHPDLQRQMSLFNSALDGIEHDFDEIEDGGIVVPEPFDNLAMCAFKGQQEYRRIRDCNAPEEILEALRQYIVQAAYILSTQGAANANAAAPMDPSMAGMDMGAPALPGTPPAAPAQAAFAPQAMQLVAG